MRILNLSLTVLSMRNFAPLLFALFATQVQAETRVGGELVKWHPVNLDVTGPMASETDNAPNPFMDIRLDITLTSPSGAQSIIPGFFAGDGDGNGEGDVWRARFAANEPGEWRYAVSFYQGDNAAVLDNTSALATLSSHGDTGEFTIAPRDENAPGFLSKGRLEYVGEHYLKFADGPYFLKSGIDSPENFFGYAGFDNTVNQPGGVSTNGLENGLHRYTTHIDDYQLGDPNFSNEDSGVDAKGIIGAVNYLSSQGVNSIYFLPMNLGGDARDTYPFISPGGSDNDNSHYDISKLYQWDIVLNHMQRKGVAAHIILNEQETGNTNWLDEGELGATRKLFYRELIARFTYLNAIKWNISEESRHGTDKHIQFARYIRSLDWAEHPVGVHTFINDPEGTYNDLLGLTEFDITSIQFTKVYANEYTETWRTRSSDAGWPWVIDMDELGPGGTGLTPENTDEMRKSVLYPVYFSGGNIEWYFGYHQLPLGGDMRTEDFRQREAMYRFTRFAREFMENNLPFWQMDPNDDALGNKLVLDQVFSLSGNIHALYLSNGEAGRELSVEDGDYELSWFDPRSGEFVGEVRSVTGSTVSVGAAPEETSQDWVVLVREATYELPVIEAPVEVSVDVPVEVDVSVDAVESPVTVPELGAANQTDNAKSGSASWLLLGLMLFIKQCRMIAILNRQLHLFSAAL